jgi:hypothetical protein
MRDLRKLDGKESYGIRRLNIELPDECYNDKNLPLDLSRDGCFEIIRNGIVLCVIASAGAGWDHISVSTPFRCPTWEEMELVAKLCFEADEVAVQYHVPLKDHINKHPYTLHWWRPRSKLKPIPLPPKNLV